MGNTLKNVGGRVGLVSGVGATLTMAFLMLAGPASATGGDPVVSAFGTLEEKVTTYGALIGTLVVAVVVLFFGIKMLKKGASKA